MLVSFCYFSGKNTEITCSKAVTSTNSDRPESGGFSQITNIFRGKYILSVGMAIILFMDTATRGQTDPP